MLFLLLTSLISHSIKAIKITLYIILGSAVMGMEMKRTKKKYGFTQRKAAKTVISGIYLTLSK